MRNVYDFQQSSSAGLNAACVAAHTATGDANKCIFAQWSSAHIKTPTFPLQSQYDASCFVFCVLISRTVHFTGLLLRLADLRAPLTFVRCARLGRLAT